ncbi:MAG: PA3496 family putative envelope integrity protein [Saccharospirillum sp.]
MTMSLFDLELANIEDDQLHKPTESSGNKRSNNHRKLAARRAIEDHLEQQRLRQELDDIELELF